MAVQIQLRNDTAANWTSNNPTLAVGELGIETDTDLFKLGNGATSWTSLGYGGVAGSFDAAQATDTKAADYTLVSADAGKLILNSAAVTITVQGLDVGKQVDFIQNVVGQITFVAGAGITLNSKDDKVSTLGIYSPAGVKCVATDTYILLGDLGL
jgi:hypothetical protein